ncbi:hypothetical protein IU471_31380, partial [Nocardia elegans]|nr:hypothetical protein [Nocardia elegans]
MSYGELGLRLRAVAAAWQHDDETRLRPGEFVATLGFTSPDYAVVDLACVWAGAVAVPLLPVRVDAATLTWPQNGAPDSVEAPLIGYAPLTFDATVPCAAITQLGPDGGVLTATGPKGAPDLERYGFLARVTTATADERARLDVVLRNNAL